MADTIYQDPADILRNAAPLYKDPGASRVLAALPSALLRAGGLLLCNTRNPVPGLPCVRDEYRTVWNEQRRRYLVVTPWGLAEPLYSGESGFYDLYSVTPLYRLVEPKEGVPAPQAQAPDSGYAVLDTVTGMTTVYLQADNDLSVPVHNARLNLDSLDGGDRILRHIRYNLVQTGVPVYPTALYAVESIPYPWETEEADFRTAHVANKEVSVPLVGYALDPATGEVVYLHIVGHKSAARSIWATLNDGGNRKYINISAHRYTRGYSSHNYITYSDPVDSDLGLYRLLIVDRRAVAQEVQDRAYLLVPKGKDAGLDLAFAARLNAVLPIPILPQWGRRLRQEGIRGNLVQMCTGGGDVGAAYVITPDPRWTELVEGLVQSGELTL